MADLREAIEHAAREYPSQPYLRFGARCLSYSGVSEALGSIALRLPPLTGLRVLLLLPEGISSALLHLECFCQGATIVPLSPFSAPAHLDYVLDRIRPDLLLTTPLLQAKFSALQRPVSVGNLGDAIAIRLRRSGENAARKATPVRAVFFTSGTTGRPKGVCLSESNLLSAARINCGIMGLDSGRRSLIMVPLYDYYGAIQLYSHALVGASCAVGESGQFPKAALDAIGSQSITDVVLVPFTLQTLLDYTESSKGAGLRAVWRNVSHIASSSDQLAFRLLQRAFALNPEMKVVNVYGLTEAGRACYKVIRTGCDPGTSIGNASPGMKVEVDAPAGQSGEVVIQGPTVMLGYLESVVNDDILFSAVSPVRTSDEGYVDAEGEVRLLGRTDQLMSLHGMKLHPSEIELPVNQMSGVSDSLASLDQNEEGHPVVVLDVVADSTRVGQDEIVDHLRNLVPRPFLPQTIRFVDVIPRTEIGSKLIRSRR